VPVLGLLVFDLCDLLDQIVSLRRKLGHLRFVLVLLILELILKIYDLLGHLLSLGLGSLQLHLSVLTLLLCSIHLLPEVIPVVDVRYPLLQHIVHRIDSFLNICWPTLEEVTNGWHSILHLSLNKFKNVRIHEMSQQISNLDYLPL